MSKRVLPVEKNQFLEVEFIDLTHEGHGVAKVEGYPIFVPNALPGEKATIKVIKTSKGYGFGKVVELQNQSPVRVEPVCSIYNQCGGCQTQHISYEGQLDAKYKQVTEVMKRIGKLEDVVIHPVLGMENPWSYRNKAQVPVGELEGGLVVGFYQKRSHEIIPMNECFIQGKENDEMIQDVKDICDELKIEPYNEQTHKGILRHIMARYGHFTNESMLVLVTNKVNFPKKEELVSKIVEKYPNITSIIQNVNNEKTNVILGNQTFVLFGSETIKDKIGDITFEISARSFYQVNPTQTKVLYDKALEYANLNGNETVIDAYCGIGSISLFLAQKAKKVYGVEIVPEAIEDAKRNATINQMTNVEFEVGKAEEVIPNWYKQGIKAEVLVVDPPRKGCDEALLNTIIDMKPSKVVYVSCNPSTLARDLRVLEDGGYETVQIQPVDMFPHTSHVECCALLILK
ncbi:23S rRNA (uracil(1939)-C(5))-methyltransferase RlmD [Gottfriedia solisilvae]|uniref:23S rRNA (uracil(1939)-C(5))-methyltransferase RlmD n=1 Tax=Gottfriedia solisilvae TaxID=1516104 RepID=UPI003D2F3394